MLGRTAQLQRIGRQVEIQEHRLTIVGEQNVGGLDVPMNDAALVGVGQGVRQSFADPQDRIDIG